jgi:sugar lactone lactonase YvrE
MDIQSRKSQKRVKSYATILNLEPIYSDNSYIVSNGPVFDYERNVGYVTDSIKRIIYIFSINDLSRNGINKKVFLSYEQNRWKSRWNDS